MSRFCITAGRILVDQLIVRTMYISISLFCAFSELFWIAWKNLAKLWQVRRIMYQVYVPIVSLHRSEPRGASLMTSSVFFRTNYVYSSCSSKKRTEELEGTGELRVSGPMSDILVRRLESYSDRVERPPLTYSDIH
jgi:hypothetical protein